MGAAVVSVAADARPDLVGHLALLAGPLPVEGKPLSYQSTSPSVGGSAEAVDADESAAERTMKFTEDGSFASSVARSNRPETAQIDRESQANTRRSVRPHAVGTAAEETE
jgi:hypothetical protein